jgi:hypothetical protein
MEILYPLVISAAAVLVTLIYASYLDIRDRRVPFVYWLPMLGIGIICVVYLLWQTTSNLSLITGYLAIVAGEQIPRALPGIIKTHRYFTILRWSWFSRFSRGLFWHHQ